MLYIKKDDRSKLELGEGAENYWQLNYCISMLCKEYLEGKGESYQTYNDIIGVLECAKMEMYRRKIANYENKKIKENGDVY